MHMSVSLKFGNVKYGAFGENVALNLKVKTVKLVKKEMEKLCYVNAMEMS